MPQRQPSISFKLPNFLRTQRERDIAKPFLDQGRIDYKNFGWNLTGRMDIYLCWMPKLSKLTVELLQALERTHGGVPCRDHREARMAQVHELILRNIWAWHGVVLPNGQFDKLTTSLPVWVAASEEGSPLGWVPAPQNRENWQPGEIRIYKGYRLNGLATEVITAKTRSASLKRPTKFYDDGFIQEPQQANMFTNDPRDVVYTGPIQLREAYVCATFYSMFTDELVLDSQRRRREQVGAAWAAEKRERFAQETRDNSHVMPPDAGRYICMADEANAMGIDVQEWSKEILIDLWRQRTGTDNT